VIGYDAQAPGAKLYFGDVTKIAGVVLTIIFFRQHPAHIEVVQHVFEQVPELQIQHTVYTLDFDHLGNCFLLCCQFLC
jgi:hypothetical protein